MKSTKLIIILVFFISTLISCTKDSGSSVNSSINPTSLPPPPPPPPSPLAGMEIQFQALDWAFWDSGFPEWDELTVTTNPARPDLFGNKPGLLYNDNINADISIKPDSLSDFYPVRPANLLDPGGYFQYSYFVIEPNLVVYASPMRRNELMGKKAIVRVKFR